MSDFTPNLVNTSSQNGMLEHTILVDAVRASRARSKAKNLTRAKGFSNAEIVSVNDSGEDAAPGFTKYEIVVTSSR